MRGLPPPPNRKPWVIKGWSVPGTVILLLLIGCYVVALYRSRVIA